MEVFSMSLALCAWNSQVTGEFSSQSPVTWSFDIFFDLHQNKWLSRDARDVRHHRAYYDIIVMNITGKKKVV